MSLELRDCIASQSHFPEAVPVRAFSISARRFRDSSEGKQLDYIVAHSRRSTIASSMPCQEKLGLLKIFWELLANCLFNHARSRENDQCFGLGMMTSPSIAKLAVTPSRGISQEGEKGKMGLVERRKRRGDLRHLHQGKRAFLHAAPPKRRRQLLRHVP